jgi:protein phosphatase
MRRTFTLSSASKTDLGLKREINEDSLFVDHNLGLFIVLDGIGGHQAGEVASQLGLTTIKENVKRKLENHDGEIVAEYNQDFSPEANILTDSLILANRAIFEAANSDTTCRGMGTTAATLLVGQSNVAIAHVGDSRIYLIRENAIERLTEDHSLVMEQVKRGLITEEQAEQSGMKNIITQALGADTIVNPTVDELVPLPDDIFLLCSDGLTDLVTDEEILEIVYNNPDSLDRACEASIAKANERGGKDNITAVLVKFTNGSNRFTSWFSHFAGKMHHNLLSRF